MITNTNSSTIIDNLAESIVLKVGKINKSESNSLVSTERIHEIGSLIDEIRNIVDQCEKLTKTNILKNEKIIDHYHRYVSRSC